MTKMYDTANHPIRKDCVVAAALIIATGKVLNEVIEIPPWLVDVIQMPENG